MYREAETKIKNHIGPIGSLKVKVGKHLKSALNLSLFASLLDDATKDKIAKALKGTECLKETGKPIWKC